jgi:hypothetical protein
VAQRLHISRQLLQSTHQTVGFQCHRG